jgi:hypothetical protein
VNDLEGWKRSMKNRCSVCKSELSLLERLLGRWDHANCRQKVLTLDSENLMREESFFLSSKRILVVIPQLARRLTLW